MKKILSVTLAAVMVMSVFSACSEDVSESEKPVAIAETTVTGNEDKTKENDENEVTGDVTETEQPEEKKEEQENEDDEKVEEKLVKEEKEEPSEGKGLKNDEKKEEPDENPAPKDNDSVFASLSEPQRIEVNKFLSNFTEAMCDSSVNYDADRKVSFAYIHCLVNGGYENALVSGAKMGISAKTVDMILERFFGESIPHETPANGYWEYENGNFVMPSASGETYAYFAVATDMTDNGNGTYTVKFNEYHDPESIHEEPKSYWYECDADQASSRYKYLGSYEAIVKPKTVNGSATYEMVEFKS